MNVYFLQPIRREDAERYVAAGYTIMVWYGDKLTVGYRGPDPHEPLRVAG